MLSKFIEILIKNSVGNLSVLGMSLPTDTVLHDLLFMPSFTNDTIALGILNDPLDVLLGYPLHVEPTTVHVVIWILGKC